MRGGQVLYRVCAVTTVQEKLDVRAVYSDKRFAGFRKLYINRLIRPSKNGWRYDESDRAKSQRHEDWLWRISEHRGLSQKRFKEEYAHVYRDEWFANSALNNGDLTLAKNYVLFSSGADDSYICTNPQEVAQAYKPNHEVWSNEPLRALTVGTAAAWLNSRRDYLRVENSSGRNVHRHIRFNMPSDEAIAWRQKLITALTATEKTGKARHLFGRSAGTARCSAR